MFISISALVVLLTERTRTLVEGDHNTVLLAVFVINAPCPSHRSQLLSPHEKLILA